MITYKGFKKDLTCRGKQFEIGSLNAEPKAKCANTGNHSAENPIDVLRYSPDISDSVYCVCNAGGDIDEDANDSKVASTELEIIRVLSLRDFFLHILIYLSKHPDVEHYKVKREEGKTGEDGYVIVCGEHPTAQGQKAGDILALLQVDSHGKAHALNVLTVGQNGIKAGKIYNVFGGEE